MGALMERERVYFISIHAPPRGGRPLRSTLALISPAISIHAPREGGDAIPLRRQRREIEFQSTPPARGATSRLRLTVSTALKFQSTPPARGATTGRRGEGKCRKISIHAPREGGDTTATKH